eukprot:m.110749 g.110749  ORF g.110749 m.110749 type:complete len:64 (+) comp15373_c0_seq16:2262-2453(+)
MSRSSSKSSSDERKTYSRCANLTQSEACTVNDHMQMTTWAKSNHLQELHRDLLPLHLPHLSTC